MTDTNDFTFNFEDAELDFDNNKEPEELPELHIAETEEEAEEVPTVKLPKPAEDKKPRFTEDEINEFLRVYDAIMFEDRFQKTYKLGKKYQVTLATRTADADMMITRQLDGMKFATMHTLQTMASALTLSHSIVELNGTDLSGKTPKERYAFIRSKSSLLVGLLCDKMISFDDLVRNALEYGEENF